MALRVRLVGDFRVDDDGPRLAALLRRCRCHAEPSLEHDTLGVDCGVSWGERMEDEMCMAFVVTAAR